MKEESPIPVRTLVLDLLKPHQPSILEIGRVIHDDPSVENVSLSVYAVDEKTESVKMIIEGEHINYDRVKKLIEENGAVIHSMDKAVLGAKHSLED